MTFICDKCGHESADEDAPCCEDLDECIAQIKQLRREKDAAYSERNKLVAALARFAQMPNTFDRSRWRAGVGRHQPDPDPTWDPKWMTVIFIDTPMGQLSWHVHDDERDLFAGLPAYHDPWDLHTTQEKYDRLGRLFR